MINILSHSVSFQFRNKLKNRHVYFLEPAYYHRQKLLYYLRKLRKQNANRFLVHAMYIPFC